MSWAKYIVIFCNGVIFCDGGVSVGRGVGLMYRIFDFLDTFLERVYFLGFCEHDGVVLTYY